jgi:RNA polymerase sigma factor (sigma-70 family)
MAARETPPAMPQNQPDRSPDAGEARTAIFEKARPRLLGLAYRILGSRSDAEDVVQDTFLRWQGADPTSIASPGAWLTMACTRRAIDMLRAAHRSRVDYVGMWLPEPVHTLTDSEAEAQLDLSSSLSTAFLLMLERLTPKERAAYLLHEIFETPYPDVAASLDMSEPACRKLVQRAKARISEDEVRYRPTRERQEELLGAFQAAVRTGQPGALARMLASEIRLSADGGGKVAAAAEAIRGDAVLPFLIERLSVWWVSYDWSIADINGAPGFVMRDAGRVIAAVSFAYDRSDTITDIFIVRNPDKLAGLQATKMH